MFPYSSGVETLTAMSTRYGSCHGPGTVLYCAIKASSCETDETFHGVWDDLSEYHMLSQRLNSDPMMRLLRSV